MAPHYFCLLDCGLHPWVEADGSLWLTLILVPITIALVVALIADLDTPSRGLIRLDQRAMQRLKADMSVEIKTPTKVTRDAE